MLDPLDDLPLLDLLCPVEELTDPGAAEWSEGHDKVADAAMVCFRVDRGRILLTLWRNKVHEVIYQTPTESEDDMALRNSRLFAHYGAGAGWNESLDNGFGKVFSRADGQRYAMWSYTMDYVTFGTEQFRQAALSV